MGGAKAVYKGYRYIDSDAHILEPADIWEKYLDPPFRSATPRSYAGYTGDPLAFCVRVLVGEYGMPFGPEGSATAVPGLEEVYGEYMAEGFTPESYRRVLDRSGIDYMVVYPTVGLYVTIVPKLDASVAAAYRRAYNTWLYDFCAAGDGRVVGVGTVDLRDPEEAAREARRCVKALGFKAIMINPTPVSQHRLYDTVLDPLWAEIADLDVPLGIHPSAGNAADVVVNHLFPGLPAAAGTSAFTLNSMVASMALIVGGVLDRHPGLRVVHLESGAGWVPFWLDRMVAGVAGGFRDLDRGFKLKPAEYFRRQCYVSADPDDPGVREVVAAIGDENIVTATDFGHPEGRGYVHAIEDTLSLEGVTEATKRKIMWDNAARLYGIR
jgi:predicted TIM-barrel fold metal-dependent hydrolase